MNLIEEEKDEVGEDIEDSPEPERRRVKRLQQIESPISNGAADEEIQGEPSPNIVGEKEDSFGDFEGRSVSSDEEVVNWSMLGPLNESAMSNRTPLVLKHKSDDDDSVQSVDVRIGDKVAQVR